MTLQELKTKVDGHLSGETFELSSQANSLNSPSINALLDESFSSGILRGTLRRMGQDTAEIQNQLLIYQVQLDPHNCAHYTADTRIESRLEFFLQNDTPQLDVVFKMPGDYYLGNSFSALKERPTLPVNRVELENDQAWETKPTLLTVRSLNPGSIAFRGHPKPTGPLQRIAWMISGEPALNGSIHFKVRNGTRYPLLDLQALIVDHLNLGLFDLEVTLRLLTEVQAMPHGDPAFTLWGSVELVTALVTPKLTLPVVMPLYSAETALLSFYLDWRRPQPQLAGLGDLTGFTAEVEPHSLLNPELSLGGSVLSLDRIEFVLNPSTKQLLSAELAISLELNWQIIPRRLELEKIGVVLHLQDPMRPKAENLSATLQALLKVGSVFFDTTVLLPDRILEASLADGSEIDILELIKTFAPGLELPSGERLNIYQLDLFAQVKKGEEAFHLEAGAEGAITLLNGLQLEALRFLFAYEQGALSQARFGSTLLLTQSQVEISLLADYQHDNGWQLDGETGPQQQLPVGHLFADLAAPFGVKVKDLPSALNDLTIDNLGLSLNTKSKDFNFHCDGHLKIASLAFDGALNISLKRQVQPQAPDTFDKSFSGKLTLRPNAQQALDFLLRFDTKPGSKTFIAAYHDQNGMIVSIDDLIQQAFHLHTHTGLSFTLKDALFAYQSNGTSKYLFGLDIEGGLNLSELRLPDLPLVGALFPADQTLKLAFQVLVPSANAAFTPQELAALSALNSGGLTFPNQELNSVVISTTLRIGDESKLLNLPIDLSNSGNGLTQASNPQASAAQPSAASAVSASGVQWINVQKSFGPVHLERVGLSYSGGKITGLLDAALSVAGLTISLDGLSVTSALHPLQPEFGLHGLGIDYRNGPLEIGGSFLRDEFTDEAGAKYTAYAGMAIIRTETLSLVAIGAYAKKDGHPSLFIYAVLDYPLGGPAFFFVIGLAAGFGYNRSLRKPPIDQVDSFPLVAEVVQSGGPAALPQDSSGRQSALATELRKLELYIPPTVGENFLAIGLRFTSFELLDSFALLIVKFGTRFEIDLLGLSTLIVPTPEAGKAVSPLAEAQLALLAAFIPDEGFLGVQGQLTKNSFVLSRDCHLTGGFAFFSWFDGPHAGDFVITLGGYHPKFQAPSHYPVVPRLGLNWQVNSNLSIKAQGYFALCAHALMAGGSLEASWHSGDFAAYFKVGADFLILWKPYHYDISVYVEMTAEATVHFFGTHHLSFDAGADVHLWGPEFTGEAHVHVKIIGIKVSFDVEFGGGASLPEPIDWATFKSSFLPKREQICSIAIASGLIKEMQEAGDRRWIINPKDFVLVSNSVIPATQAPGHADKMAGANTAIAIAPMGLATGELVTTHRITITRDDDPAGDDRIAAGDFSLQPVLKAVPAGLWGAPKLKIQNGKKLLEPADLNGKRFVDKTLAGFEVRPGKPPDPGLTHWIDPEHLGYEMDLVPEAFTWQSFDLDRSQGADAWRVAEGTILRNAKRDELLHALGIIDAEFDLGEPISDGVLVPQR